MILQRANASGHPARSRMLNKLKASKDLHLLASHPPSAPSVILHNIVPMIVSTAVRDIVKGSLSYPEGLSSYESGLVD